MAKVGRVRCVVPGCKRLWILHDRQFGFQKNAAESHCRAHLRRFHKEQGHEDLRVFDNIARKMRTGDAFECRKCKRAVGSDMLSLAMPFRVETWRE